MSLGNSTFMPLVFALYAVGMTNAVGSYAEQTVCSLADMARTDTSRFELAVRSSSPAWYLQGMQLFAYECTKKRWSKRIVTWAVMRYTNSMSWDRVNAVIEAAFGKWRKAIPDFLFLKVAGSPQADIRFYFYPISASSYTHIPTKDDELDAGGADIFFNDDKNWTNASGGDWCNLRMAALYEIGHALGLKDSTTDSAIMFRGADPCNVPDNDLLHLDDDDVDGVQFMYPRRKC